MTFKLEHVLGVAAFWWLYAALSIYDMLLLVKWSFNSKKLKQIKLVSQL
jgi:hypothetical protein